MANENESSSTAPDVLLPGKPFPKLELLRAMQADAAEFIAEPQPC